MSNATALFYRHSGKFPPYAPFMILGGGLVTGVLGGMAYGIIDWLVPFIYILILATLGLGFGQAIVVYQLFRLAKIRNLPVAAVCGLGSGLFAWYGSWIGWIYAGSDWTLLTFNPVEIVDIARFTAETGTWGMSSGDPVTGGFLYAFWFVEAAIIVVPSALVAHTKFAALPYNERAQAWADDTASLPPLMPLSDPERAALKQGLAQGDFGTLVQLRPLEFNSDVFTTITFRSVPDFDDEQFMSIKAMTTSVDSNGKLTVKAKPIITNMIVDKESRQLIQEIYAEPEAEEGAQWVNEADPADGDVDDANGSVLPRS
ncbi:hypothetical protein OT109_04450 [Phycisphaeraceae bacterium D3-23]